MRTFISIDIPEEIRKEILKIQKQLPEFSGKITEKENLHLTLKFLGEISGGQAEKIKEELEKIKFKRFEAEISEIGVFDENFIRIVWLKIENCGNIQKEIDDRLSFLFPKEERFMSHLTIARVKNIKDRKKFISGLGKIKTERKKFIVSEFYLKKSILAGSNPVYENLLEVKLI